MVSAGSASSGIARSGAVKVSGSVLAATLTHSRLRSFSPALTRLQPGTVVAGLPTRLS